MFSQRQIGIAMKNDLEKLTRLLRIELTAVHQQFSHMLALRQWKDEDLLRRITEVDTEDFRNAMQIIDLLVANGLPINLESHRFFPGSDIASVVRSELRIEQQFADILVKTKVADPEAKARVQRASAPRREYREWLTSQADSSSDALANGETGKPMAEFLAHLIVLVEQPMLHAFLLWHLGDRTGADNAWRLSGAAMLYGAALVKRGAAKNRVPIPATIPGVRMAANQSEAHAADTELVKLCASVARHAAETEAADDAAMGRLCVRIADDCDLIADMKLGEDFPAVFGRSPAFESFATTRDRHLR
jgi:bacterioferritin (cytochrome b1)